MQGPRPLWKRKRVLFPLALMLVLAALLGVTVVRGTWADAVARNPATPEEGVVVQLLQPPGGRKQVRHAQVLPAPRAVVWSVITDYARFPEVFARLDGCSAQERAPGQFALQLGLLTPFGRFDVQTLVRHKQSGSAWVAGWDQAVGRLRVNRGSWTLVELGPERTLVVYALEIDVARCPRWLVNNVLLSMVGRELSSVASAVERRRRVR